MEKYKKYYGVIIFCVALVALIALVVYIISPKVTELNSLKNEETQKQEQVNELQGKLDIVKAKIKKIKNSITSSQKKIYSPIENDLGNETLFFTLYNDVIEMIHANSVKIKSIDYTYNPEADALYIIIFTMSVISFMLGGIIIVRSLLMKKKLSSTSTMILHLIFITVIQTISYSLNWVYNEDLVPRFGGTMCTIQAFFMIVSTLGQESGLK